MAKEQAEKEELEKLKKKYGFAYNFLSNPNNPIRRLRRGLRNLIEPAVRFGNEALYGKKPEKEEGFSEEDKKKLLELLQINDENVDLMERQAQLYYQACEEFKCDELSDE